MLFIAVCLFGATAVFGCGKGFVGLGGQVTYSDNGEPLECGTVSLTNGSIQARGEIGKDGKYVIGSLVARDGLPPGPYRVCVANAVKKLWDPNDDFLTEPLIDVKFTDPNTSGLTLNVDASTKNKFDFQVDRYVPSKK